MSFPFTRILNPIDLENRSVKALDMAANIARMHKATLMLFTVEPLDISEGAPMDVGAYKQMADARDVRLQNLAKKRLSGIEYETLTKVGKPAEEIVEVAKKWHADLIVMATHGRAGVSRVLLGSVAEHVLRQTPCPILLLRLGGG